MKISLALNRRFDSVHDGIITSNKGGQKLILNGFIYTKQITNPRNIRWRCVQRTTDCKETLTTTLDLDDQKFVTAHNHDPSDTKVAAVKCRSEMKQQAKLNFDKTSQIMTKAMSHIDVAARVDWQGRVDKTYPT